MAIYTPYTYLIGWSTLDKWYYGVRYAKKSKCLYETGCHPDELWVTYFTSSDYVKNFILENGEPDIIQIRKTFDSKESATKWEEEVLKRINAHKRSDFLNKHAGKSIILSEEVLERISRKRKEKWNSLSAEEQQNIREERRNRSKSFWDSMCETKKMFVILKSEMKKEENRKRNWDDDFKEQLKMKKQESWKTSPKKEEHSRKTRDRRIKEEANKTREERKLHSELTKAGLLKRTEQERIKTSEKLSTSIKNSYESDPNLRESRSRTSKGRIAITKNGKNKKVWPDELEYYINRGWSKGCKQNRVSKNKSCLGKKAITKNGRTKFIDASEISNYMENGWILGNSQKDKKKEKSSTKGRTAITKNNMTKFVESGQVDSFLEMGWVLGISQKGKKKEKSSTTGRIAIIKDTKMKYIFPDDLEKYIQEGWKLRRKSNLSS
jgi:hypothetical protein